MNEAMNTPVRSSSSSLLVFMPVFITVFLITSIIATAITFILPESYASTCRIKVEQDATLTAGAIAYDPQFLQTTFELIQSQLVLGRAVDRLNLNVEWGKKYFNGELLKTSETLQILKGRLSLADVRGTKLIAITVYSDDRNEAARVANAVADAYRDYRVETAAQTGDAARMKAAETAVIVTDKAEPGMQPVKPNKPVNIALGMVCGIVFGSVAGFVVVIFTGWLRKRAA